MNKTLRFVGYALLGLYAVLGVVAGVAWEVYYFHHLSFISYNLFGHFLATVGGLLWPVVEFLKITPGEIVTFAIKLCFLGGFLLAFLCVVGPIVGRAFKRRSES